MPLFPSWKERIRRLAVRHGLIDPITVLTRLERLAQPSEVQVPMELLRAGIAFHARGLMNTRVIQNNLDWVWPYWVVRQFDPHDSSFLPRAFSITHVNLTHRNWTAVGIPDCNALPIVDPRGMLTPFFDGWSIDAAIFTEHGINLFPSKADNIEQQLIANDEGLRVETISRKEGLVLRTTVWVEVQDGHAVCRMICEGTAQIDAWLAISLRPYNTEGVSFIRKIELDAERKAWLIDGRRIVHFNKPAERHATSRYERGDVFMQLPNLPESMSVDCEVGLVTAAALFQISSAKPARIEILIPLDEDKNSAPTFPKGAAETWQEALAGTASLHTPDEHFNFLYDAAVRSLIMHAPLEVYPGPYTYKRFWFRDAAFILHALLVIGCARRVGQVLEEYPRRQRIDGFFHSQDGEWDSNGEALWILRRFCQLTGQPPKQQWRKMITSGAKWIIRKRTRDDGSDHAGLLPAGFSAEHLGTNDFYYWDDFWGIAGLKAAAEFCEEWGDKKSAGEFAAQSGDMMAAVICSIERSAWRRHTPGLPASPHRRPDAGSIGSIAASYPLALWQEKDSRIIDTANFLMSRCFFEGAFFQEMTHSGINAYLTLHIAQVLLRAGDERFFSLVESIAALASPTGQWPEAIHPITKGGCMGDGHHVWASAEWVLMLRNMFVREEPDKLVLCSGVPRKWLDRGEKMSFGPTLTEHGPITVEVKKTGDAVEVSWRAEWRGRQPLIEVRIAGCWQIVVREDETRSVNVPCGPEKPK